MFNIDWLMVDLTLKGQFHFGKVVLLSKTISQFASEFSCVYIISP